MSAYSAVSFGHAHPRIVARADRAGAAARGHVARVSSTTGCRCCSSGCARLTGLDRALPVEQRRRSGRDRAQGRRASGRYKVKGVPDGRAEIIGCKGNFHGRSITIDGPVVRAAVPRRLRARSRRASSDALRRCRGARSARSRRTRRRSWSSRCRARAASSCRRTGYLARVRADLPRAQRPPDLRRGADRSRPHRPDARLRARRRAARRRHPRQGAGRRPAAGVRCSSPPTT